MNPQNATARLLYKTVGGLPLNKFGRQNYTFSPSGLLRAGLQVAVSADATARSQPRHGSTNLVKGAALSASVIFSESVTADVQLCSEQPPYARQRGKRKIASIS